LLKFTKAGPVKPPSRARYEQPPPRSTKRATTNLDVEEGSDIEQNTQNEDDQELSSLNESLEDASVASSAESADPVQPSQGIVASFNLTETYNSTQRPPRKRKRQIKEDDLEGKYMLRLAKEEEEEVRQAKRRLKRQKLVEERDPEISEEEQDLNAEADSHKLVESEANPVKADPLDAPQHETLAPDKDAIELEKSSRTVFLANVSTAAITDKKANKTLLNHMASFLDSLHVQDGKKKHKVESIRFRSTAYAGTGLPKKAAFATKNLMEATTKSTNAYVVYSTAFAAREAVKKLNGTMVLDRHLRVDGVAHPAKADHRRCVFVGNLGFVDDESMMDQGGENERKRSKIPSDVEEGLWRQFSKAGTVESVRVVRDEKTRVGKGFAYVQFQVSMNNFFFGKVIANQKWKDANSVEKALLFHDKKYPPMLPRVLRVTRAKAVKKTALASQHTRPAKGPLLYGSSNPNRERIYNPKISGQHRSLQGRAAKLLGRAGAARLKGASETAGEETQPRKHPEGIIKTPESIVFEGYRASQKAGKPKDLKLGGSGGGKKKGKPRTRSSKRASDWKKSGGKKMK
jgi:nucleolar protein 12